MTHMISLANNKFIEESLDKNADFEDRLVIKSIIKRIAKLTDMPENDIFERFNKKKNKHTYTQPEIKETVEEKDSLLHDDFIRLCCSDNIEVRKFIFTNLNTDWIKSETHSKIYDKLYIHLKSKGQMPINLIADQIENEKIKDKLYAVVHELDRINPTYAMAVDAVTRLEKEILKIKRPN